MKPHASAQADDAPHTDAEADATADARPTAYLYDADGNDREIALEDVTLADIGEHQLLWALLPSRDEAAVRGLVQRLGFAGVSVRDLLDTAERPKVERFGSFYRVFVNAVAVGEDGQLDRLPIDFLVGRNFIATISDAPVAGFAEFRRRERGDTALGVLDAEAFLATLLDLHIVSYFRAIERVEQEVEQVDKRILMRDLDEREFLKDMVRLRSRISRLRRWFLPHRDVFYALARPDFLPQAEQDRRGFRLLHQHFDSVVDMMGSARDSVFGLFDLYTTRASHRMNSTMRRLTFVALVTGASGVLAGILGMNFKAAFFDSPNGFWYAVSIMVGFALVLTLVARWRRWL